MSQISPPRSMSSNSWPHRSASCHLVEMITDPASWPKACAQVRAVPFPCALADGFRHRVFARAHRIVNNNQVRPKAENGLIDTGCEKLPARLQLPAPCSLTIRSQPQAESFRLLGNQVANLAAPSFRQLAGMACRDDRRVGMIGKKPGRKQKAAIGGFTRARWAADHQPIDLATADSLEPVDQQSLMAAGANPQNLASSMRL